MKHLSIVVLIFVFSTVLAQSYKIGTIDIYGNRKIPNDSISAALIVKEGDSVTREMLNPEAIAGALRQIPGVRHATVYPVCCDKNGNLTLFVGIGETDSVILRYRGAPREDILLPAEVIDAYTRFENELEPAIMKGEGGEDDSHGYALNKYIPARKEQNKFIRFAKSNLALLVNILRHSGNASHRAAAALILAYSNDRKGVVDNLLYAVTDPDEDVRNNATRALGVLTGYLNSHPAIHIKIPADQFIKMINSIVWTERNKGANALMQLSVNRNPELLRKIRQQALSSIIEMARWKDREHTIFSFVILGRIAGVKEDVLFAKNFSEGYNVDIESMLKKLRVL